MLTLTGQREIAKCNIYPDDIDPLIWYMMPQGPRIALDDSTGKPVFSLVEYRRDVSQLTDEERKTRLGGGILTLSTELSATDDQMKEIRRTIAGDPELQGRLAQFGPLAGPSYANWWNNEISHSVDKLAEALKVSTVPVTEGTVTLAILAESPDAGHPGEFVSTLERGDRRFYRLGPEHRRRRPYPDRREFGDYTRRHRGQPLVYEPSSEHPARH